MLAWTMPLPLFSPCDVQESTPFSTGLWKSSQARPQQAQYIPEFVSAGLKTERCMLSGGMTSTNSRGIS